MQIPIVSSCLLSIWSGYFKEMVRGSGRFVAKSAHNAECHVCIFYTLSQSILCYFIDFLWIYYEIGM